MPPRCPRPVSYTHLDVYKRQRLKSDKVAIGSLVIVVFFVLVAIFAPLLVALEGEELNKYHPELISAANTYPSIGATPQHWFGVCLLYTSRCV